MCHARVFALEKAFASLEELFMSNEAVMYP